jgi:hypothetical protein
MAFNADMIAKGSAMEKKKHKLVGNQQVCAFYYL